jgi:hypothetical protein
MTQTYAQQIFLDTNHKQAIMPKIIQNLIKFRGFG